MAGTTRESKTILTAEDRTGGAFASMMASARSAHGSLMSMHGALAGIAGGAILGGFASMVKSSLEYADAVGKSAQKTGMLAEEFSQLAYAAKLSDVSNEQLVKGFKGLSEMMVKAADATTLQSATMKALGVDIAGGTAPALEKIADQFAKLPDGAVKTALAVDLFGKAGQDMIPMLNQGSEGLRRMKDEAAEMGLTISGQVARDAERFNDNLKTLGSRAQATGNSLVTHLAAHLADVTDAMKRAQIESGNLMALWVGLGGVAAKIFTDDSLTAAEKTQKKINALTGELAQLRQRMLDAQDVMGPWGEKLRAGLVEAAKKGTLELAGLNRELATLYRQQADRDNAAKNAEAATKAEEERIAKIRERHEAEKKAAEEVRKWNERLQKEDVKGWIAHAEAVFAESDKLYTDLARISDEYWKDEDKKKAEDIKGWVAYAEQVFKEADENNLAIAKINDTFWRDHDKRIAESARVYEDLADMGSRFFADLVMNGRSAFDRLRDMLKQFVAELVALFAKKWILQMAGNFIGGPMGQTLLSMAGGTGQGTMAGSLLNAGGSSMMAIGGSAVLGGIGGYVGARAMGAGDRGQRVGGMAGAAGGAALGMMLGGPIGAVLGALAGAIIGKLTDPNGLAQRTGHFGDSALGGDTRTRGSSAFGGFGITRSQWFGDDMIGRLREFFDGLGKIENTFAGFLKPAEIERVRAAMAGREASYNFGTEHGDFSGALGQILKDRIGAIFAAIDPALQQWLDGFEGTGEELAAWAAQILQVRDMLKTNSIAGLSLESVKALQAEGETLAATMGRVMQTMAGINSVGQTEHDALAALERDIRALFESIGQTMPGNLDAWRALAATIDLSTTAGRDLFNVMGAVGQSFAQAQAAVQNAIAGIWASASSFGGPQFARVFTEQKLRATYAQWQAMRGENFSFEEMLQHFAGFTPQMLQEGIVATQSQYGASGVALLQQLFADFAAYQQALGQSTTTLTNTFTGLNGSVADFAAQLASARGNLADYLNASLVSSLSPLSPMAQYAEARRQYDANYALAQGGDIDAIARFGGLRDTFLGLSRSIYASSGQYNTDFFSTFNQGAGLTNGAVTPYTAAHAAQNTASIVEALGGVVSALGDTLQVQDAEVRAGLDEVKAMLMKLGSGPLTNTAGALA